MPYGEIIFHCKQYDIYLHNVPVKVITENNF